MQTSDDRLRLGHGTTLSAIPAGGETQRWSVGRPGSESAPTDVPPGSTERFVIEAEIGAGGMGVVYLARDTLLTRKVAIKIVRRERVRNEQHAGTVRLLREARAMAQLSHPSVVTVYELGMIGPELFIAMEYVEGETLRQWQARQRVPREVLDVYLQAGSGLAAAHRAGLVHRDFKPENVLIDRASRARVTDFGLVGSASHTRADTADADETDLLAASLTRPGAVAGTPAYMAPEQRKGGVVDAAADQFSFCVALYEALHGQRPVVDRNEAHRSDPGLTHAPRRSGVPAAVRRLLLRGMSADPSERFPSMDELLERLRAAWPVEPERRTRVRSRRAIAMLVGGAGLGGLAVATVADSGRPVATSMPTVIAAPLAAAPRPPAPAPATAPATSTSTPPPARTMQRGSRAKPRATSTTGDHLADTPSTPDPTPAVATSEADEQIARRRSLLYLDE